MAAEFDSDISSLSESDPEHDGDVFLDKGKGKETDLESRTLVQSGFDAYFALSAAKGRALASGSRFSALVQPLSADEYTEGISAAAENGEVRLESAIVRDPEERADVFERMMLELREGFNVLCHGFGSKRELLNDFAKTRCAKKGHVVIVNGFHPELTVKDLLSSIEASVPGLVDAVANTPASTPDAQARRIHDFFSQKQQKVGLYLIIHSIDALLTRLPKAKSPLSILALHSSIHVVASVDHVNSPMLWSASEASARKDAGNTSQRRGFAWIWHDLTTLAPYDTELAFADRTSITGASRVRKSRDTESAANASGLPLSDTAVAHVLAAVTERAKEMFALLSKHQLDSIDAADPTLDAMQAHGIVYDALFPLSRAKFIATNDTQLRAQLGEFRDHGLVVSAQSGASEILWIPMRKERLARVYAGMDKTN
ncbi:DNA replication origin binding protein [Mycena chlorophos]|uniref:Origin recognition complex subunit 2 n=1 Tax=Mycena chlorophos TaxID=658473 RepID=A0A8H6SL27_MYCCL|nr:DNA replication origin binding protein [Mycena chlorophos]